MHTKEDIMINTLEGMAADAEDAGKESVLINPSYDDIKMINADLNVASGNAKECSCKPYNELEATVPLMLNDNYKNRFVAEYRQTKYRYEKLKKFNTEIEAALLTEDAKPEQYEKKVMMQPHSCPPSLLREQQSAMGNYLHILELRAVIENIEL
jgi:hypothetical protein